MNKTNEIKTVLERIVLTVHHRNGGQLTQLSPECRLLDPALRLDSLDLAEIMVSIEKQFGIAPFETSQPPKTWGDVIQIITAG